VTKIDKPFIACAWSDAHCISGATELAEHEIPHAAATYTAYGFVLRSDDVGITIATEVSEQGTYRSINFIPRKMIQSVVEFKLSAKKPIKAAVQVSEG
jgi:hypothetical protein